MYVLIKDELAGYGSLPGGQLSGQEDGHIREVRGVRRRVQLDGPGSRRR